MKRPLLVDPEQAQGLAELAVHALLAQAMEVPGGVTKQERYCLHYATEDFAARPTDPRALARAYIRAAYRISVQHGFDTASGYLGQLLEG